MRAQVQKSWSEGMQTVLGTTGLIQVPNGRTLHIFYNVHSGC